MLVLEGCGNTVTVSGNGQSTVQSADGKTANYSIASYSYTLDDGKYNAQLSGPGNANLQITIEQVQQVLW